MADLSAKRIAEFIKPFRVEPGSKVRLSRDFDPSGTRRQSKSEAKELLAQGVELLAEYQGRLAAQDTYGVLVILQAMDAAGKDGTIRHVMSGVNPQGVQVSSFKVPSPEDLDHDYLWRYARRLPERGNIGIFNRSYYEEVLVVRVHPQILGAQKLPPSSKRGDVWQRRFREINDWERYLTDQGFRIVKLFLHLSKEEQRRRFLSRIDEPEKNWKFSANDAKERAYWDDYQKAFSEVLSNTSTEWAPWHVIPADDKPFARVAAAGVLAQALIEIDPRFPKVGKEAREALAAAKLELEAQAPPGEAPDPSRPPPARRLAETARRASATGRRPGRRGQQGRRGDTGSRLTRLEPFADPTRAEDGSFQFQLPDASVELSQGTFPEGTSAADELVAAIEADAPDAATWDIAAPEDGWLETRGWGTGSGATTTFSGTSADGTLEAGAAALQIDPSGEAQLYIAMGADTSDPDIAVGEEAGCPGCPVLGILRSRGGGHHQLPRERGQPSARRVGQRVGHAGKRPAAGGTVRMATGGSPTGPIATRFIQ